MLRDEAETLFRLIAEAARRTGPAISHREVGRVIAVGAGVARVAGLGALGTDELVRFPREVMGLAMSLSEDAAGIVLLGHDEGLGEGDEAHATGRRADIPVGEDLLGRVLDPLGRPLDGRGPPAARQRLPVERPAPPIMHRAPVVEPLQTGIKAIDAAIPIGRGQRELIIGDRQTGKTAIALDTILNQRDTGVLSVYCAIGQRETAVARVVARLRAGGALGRTVIVMAGGGDAPGLQYIAPYAAMTVAEHFMAAGRDTLVVFDDLTRHARAYRELSLLLGRPPAREAYPGDIFHLHARLLERATRLRPEHGGGSLTALPVIETQAHNMTAYIPTNLISITDGQISLSAPLFERGQLPAIDIGRSVSRVGGKAQRPAFRAVAGDLRLAHAQYEELESFARFGTRLDADTRARLERGRRVRAILAQAEGDPLGVGAQIAVLVAATTGALDRVAVDRVAAAERAIRAALARAPGGLEARIAAGARLEEADRRALDATIARAVATVAEGGEGAEGRERTERAIPVEGTSNSGGAG